MFYALLLLLILLAISYLIYLHTANSSPSITLPTLSIVQDNYCDSSVERYCKIWGHSYNIQSSECSLFLNDQVSSLNYNRSLTFLLSLMSNKEYIYFYNGLDDTTHDNYIIKPSSLISKDDILHEINKLPIPTVVLLKNLHLGYPYVTTRGIILHRAYIDQVFQNKSLPFDPPSIIPDVLPRRHIKPPTKIPHVLYQTHYSRVLPSRYSLLVNSWLDHNHEYDYYFFDDSDCRTFILENFERNVLIAYDKLIPSAYKSDLWRYCMIYSKGGVYANINLEPSCALSSIIDPNSDLVYVEGFNGFFAASPKHPLLKKLITHVVSRILNNEYGSDPSYPTGNIPFQEILSDEHSQIITLDYFNITPPLDFDPSGFPHYSHMWFNKSIYRHIIT